MGVVPIALESSEGLQQQRVVRHDFSRLLYVQAVSCLESCGTLIYVGFDYMRLVGQGWPRVDLIYPCASRLFAHEVPSQVVLYDGSGSAELDVW